MLHTKYTPTVINDREIGEIRFVDIKNKTFICLRDVAVGLRINQVYMREYRSKFSDHILKCYLLSRSGFRIMAVIDVDHIMALINDIRNVSGLNNTQLDKIDMLASLVLKIKQQKQQKQQKPEPIKLPANQSLFDANPYGDLCDSINGIVESEIAKRVESVTDELFKLRNELAQLKSENRKLKTIIKSVREALPKE
ncbi:MAG: hypothetical protein ACRDD8_05875 [Bacteroidales bacterium]